MTAQLINVFVFSYAINRFSHDEAHLFLYPILDFTDYAKMMEKHVLDAYYKDKDFVSSAAMGGSHGEKKIRPKRQAGTKALQTVQKALNDSGDEVNLCYINKHTLKFLNFWMPENSLKIQTKRPN